MLKDATFCENVFLSTHTRPRFYKTFFMLKSTKHEISTAHKN